MESCVLPCRFHSSREIHIHWVQLKARPVPVRSFHSNQSQQDQDQRFRGRASLFWDQISRGNASLLLKGVKVQDEGRYECFTSSSAANSHSFINLMVDATGNRMSCSSEGIYPSPEHSWSFRASSNTTVQSAIRVSRTAEQRYDINSSLMLSEGVSFLTFSCSFSTRRRAVQLRDEQRGGGGDQRHDAEHAETPGWVRTRPGNPTWQPRSHGITLKTANKTN
uniref:Ig-like domain-containing protein n=1 Tax=Poecilia latipinna TaxID=48699 RepID=A0A3B3V5D0_9TELE